MKALSLHGLPSRFRAGPWLAGAALTLLAMAGGVRAATDMYMKLDGIPGETTIGPTAGWIRLSSIGSGVALLPPLPPTTIPVPAVFHCAVRKPIDEATPKLFERIVDQQLIPRMTLSVVEDGTQTLRVTLLNARISSAALVGGDGGPVEEVSFNYQKIEWSTHDLSGGGGQTVSLVPLTGQASIKPRLPFRATLERLASDPGKLRLTCPVEAGRTYRVHSTTQPGGAWEPVGQFTATEDGTVEQMLSFRGNALFFRVEALD